ncbi:hypothetical protein BX661DRAFT_179613, partial [Kickxella alabastrina]|uniref:uncharacterized protein n=1 Tax=Kickxella alabastrina TaxID=61397 RepID=UPI00221F405B
MFRIAARRASAAPGLRLSAAQSTLAVGGLGYLYVTDSSAGIHKYISTPLLRLMDAEAAHDLAITALKHGVHPVDRKPDDPLLATTLWGKRLGNPVGLAAGFDKNAEAVDALFALGFGAVEGNPRPRLFRADNCGTGMEAFAERVRSRQRQGETVAQLTRNVNRSALPDRLLGINLSKNKASAAESFEDYTRGIAKLGAYADYVVINVSCPNVKNIAAASDIGVLQDTVRAVTRARDQMPEYRPPVVLKIGPDNDVDQLRVIAQMALEYGIDGIITANTTRTRPAEVRGSEVALEEGGLSGPPLKSLALETTRR